ncbi:MAG: murein transglycosylase A [Desulfobacter sp.]|nr:murein transglycosylase A [Desulfobacter sp.]WDP87356.1 MAG: murein transglycosylase A [Desulfobacter sp.]
MTSANSLEQPPFKRAVVLFFFLVLSLILFTGCRGKTTPEDVVQVPVVKISSRQYPKFLDTLGFENLESAIDQSLVYFNRVPPTRTYVYGKDQYDAVHMIHSLETFKQFLIGRPTGPELNQFIRKWFHVYKSVGNTNGQVLFTGYFEPTYKGSLTRSDNFSFPVYSMPQDLFQIDLSKFSDKYKGHKRLMARVAQETGQVLPYYARKEINTTPDFEKRAEPVVWLASRVDRFFLEIQGSGRMALENGEELRVHYAGSNGNAYRSVGRYLIDKNEIPREKMSMQAIREWLEKNPSQMDEVLHFNKSVVFFKAGKGGPFGSIGVAITPLRAIATDPKVFPKGGLAFVETALPGKENQPKDEWERASFFALNQDTGGAIKGPGRVDIFCGNRNWAEFTAGHMTAHGQIYFLVMK